MTQKETDNLLSECAVLRTVARGGEVMWFNPDYDPQQPLHSGAADSVLTEAGVADAAARLERFAPLISRYFPETAPSGGIIESPLREIPQMSAALSEVSGLEADGSRMLLKMDSHLPVSGSVKARGGIYEVLKHTEDLALEAGLLSSRSDDCLKLATPEARAFFGRHRIQVGSTGNLGLSIGIMSAALGYEAIVHMSSDAKQWKKDLLRKRGATVCEYSGDYGSAVASGRALSDADPCSYFVDDEKSTDLFVGYATAGERLRRQLDAMHIAVDARHPLNVYIPCGVGGAPGGIIFGLKLIYGDAVRCWLVEPTEAPCMLAGLASGLYSNICVQDLGLSGCTSADGLAVGRASAFVGKVIRPLVSGEATVEDSRLIPYLRLLKDSEGILAEPSACAAFHGYVALRSAGLKPDPDATHVIWATGGSMVPDEVWKELGID